MSRALLALAIVLAGVVRAEDAAAPEWTVKPRLEGIVVNVPKLARPFPENWQPTLFWWQVPLSWDDPAQLKSELTALAERGLLPCVEVSADYPDYRAYAATPEAVAQDIARAKAMAAAGFPVHLSMKGVLDLYCTPGGPTGQPVVHADNPDGDKKSAIGGQFRCLPMRDGWTTRHDHLRGLFQQYADAGVPVAGVWYDYEGLPHPWNGYYEHSMECPGCRAAIPPEALATREAFVAWATNLRHEAEVEALAKPVREALPGTRIGFYGFRLASFEYPMTTGIGTRIPPADTNPEEIDVIQPVCYASKGCLLRYFNADWPITQQAADVVYLAALLRTMANNHHTIRANQSIVPYVSSYVGARKQRETPRLSKPLYREFLRHAILRGARGFYVFNVAPPYGAMTDYYAELADVNNVYNEIFAAPCRDFLEGDTTVLSDTWHDPSDPAPVAWSGLAKGDRALIRIVSLAEFPRLVDVVPFPAGPAVRVLAPQTGAWYIVTRAGTVTPVAAAD